MSALQFLNKKSWHTATIKNNEKVWLKEQAAEKEQKRMEELQKQLEEERKLQEIQRMEEKSGRLDPAELLKRRRLNWMYEHGPDKNEEKQKEKDREDVLLGRKEVDLDKLQKPVNHTSLAEEEAKMREDPLVKIELERARVLKLAGRDPSRRTDSEGEAKRKRKEERARIREERRVRREKRALRQSARSRSTGADEVRRDTGERRRGVESEKKVHTSHEQKMEELRAIEQQLLAETYGSPRKSDEERTPVRKRQRRDSSSERYEHSVERTRQHDESRDGRDREYGLSLPQNGSGVAVTREFVPKSRRRRWDEGRNERRESYRDRNHRDASPDRRRHRDSRKGLSSEERERRLEEMRRDADQIDAERRARVKRYVREEREERRNLYAREDPTRSFARDCISAGVSAGSAAERIRQRRAWNARDSNVAY